MPVKWIIIWHRKTVLQLILLCWSSSASIFTQPCFSCRWVNNSPPFLTLTLTNYCTKIILALVMVTLFPSIQTTLTLFYTLFIIFYFFRSQVRHVIIIPFSAIKLRNISQIWTIHLRSHCQLYDRLIISWQHDQSELIRVYKVVVYEKLENLSKRWILSFRWSLLDQRHFLNISWSLDHNLEAEDHLRVVLSLGGADVAVGEWEPPGEPHWQILLAPGELCPHRRARAGGGGKMSLSPNNDVAESQN